MAQKKPEANEMMEQREGAVQQEEAIHERKKEDSDKLRSDVLCWHFMANACKFGPRCRFSHDVPPDRVCPYFWSGGCKFGSRCKNFHDLHRALPYAVAGPVPAYTSVLELVSYANGAPSPGHANTSPVPAFYNNGGNQPSFYYTIPVDPQGHNPGNARTLPHGDKCEYCNIHVFHPTNKEQRGAHQCESRTRSMVHDLLEEVMER